MELQTMKKKKKMDRAAATAADRSLQLEHPSLTNSISSFFFFFFFFFTSCKLRHSS
jgi:hypothetical protein